MTRCDRCHQETMATTGSMFNTQMICTDKCMDAEKAHPDYKRAVDTENAACLRGDYNFPGIGLPADLR